MHNVALRGCAGGESPLCFWLTFYLRVARVAEWSMCCSLRRPCCKIRSAMIIVWCQWPSCKISSQPKQVWAFVMTYLADFHLCAACHVWTLLNQQQRDFEQQGVSSPCVSTWCTEMCTWTYVPDLSVLTLFGMTTWLLQKVSVALRCQFSCKLNQSITKSFSTWRVLSGRVDDYFGCLQMVSFLSELEFVSTSFYCICKVYIYIYIYMPKKWAVLTESS